MNKLWNMLENEPSFPDLQESGYELVSQENSECDLFLCGIEDVEYAGAFVNPLEVFMIVALDDPKNELHLIPSIFSAWIDRKKLERLPLMLKQYTSHIDEKQRYKQTNALLKRLMVDTTVHQANLQGIKKSMKESTKEIEQIFEARVEDMRSIHKDTALALEHLVKLKEQIEPEVFENLEESWNMTNSILKRSDDVIKAMFGFVSVLQCEDRITQMIDGIDHIINDDIATANEYGIVVVPELQKEFKERLVPFYTIQEQRDYAQGADDALKGCKPDNVDIDDFTLF